MAGFTLTAKNQGLGALAGNNPSNTWNWFSLHTADPLLTGANELVGTGYARQLTTWAAPANAQMGSTQVTFNIPGGATIAYWGIWTNVSGGTFGFGEPLPVTEIYPTNGLYLLTVTLTAAG